MFHVDRDDCHITLTIREIENLSKDDKMKEALKLHRQFGHASEMKLKKLVKESDCVYRRCLQNLQYMCSIQGSTP